MQRGNVLNEAIEFPSNLMRRLEGDSASVAEAPLRSALFSAAQMAAHGRALAGIHKLSESGAPDRLLSRLSSNGALIGSTCATLAQALKDGRQITPASEWLLDNLYLIEEQVRIARRHLPKHYSRELPRLANPDCAERPRVYQIALEIIAHGDGRVDPDSLAGFVAAYQEHGELRLGELWAIPIMLRLALIENLRRVAAQVAANRLQRDRAGSWADQMIATAERAPSELILLVADMVRAKTVLSCTFVAELTRRLQGRSPALTMALSWLSTKLAETGLTIDQQVQAEVGQQAADQLSISNSIASLRFLGTMDWQQFVETMSGVEQTLRQDPCALYAKMDFATRDQYRHVVEQLARNCAHSEGAVAAQVLELARAAADSPEAEQRHSHVGYYLLGAGLATLERRLGVHHRPGAALRRLARRAPLLSYLGAIGALTALCAGGVIAHALHEDLHGWRLAALATLAVLAGSQLALALVNWSATQLATPHRLPRMDYKDGIDPAARTLVVVPTLIYSRANITELCDSLEVHFLANRDPNLRFCLLTDFADANAENLPGDIALLEHARATIDALNAKYALGAARPGPFLLLHRPRSWNRQQQAWIGMERKRGKLADLNAYLRGAARTKFSLVVGDTSELERIAYVITLDTDTRLPRDAARQFVAAMAHPLNRPRLDAAGRRVLEGYAILQPRVATSVPSEQASRYELLCGGEAGLDPYTRSVSDLYQDVFYEGSFIGKGIYDVDMFERVMRDRLPDNQILSHDLLEGCYLRAGLLSDTQLYESYPARYSADVSRRQRWIRGDWQLAGWLRASVPANGGARREPNPLSGLSRWKLFDNLRRSLDAVVLTAALLLAWSALGQPWFWSGAALAVLALPPLVSAAFALLRKGPEALWRQHVRVCAQALARQGAHALLTLAFLPYEAYVSLDAISRTGWRMLVSHTHLLEWRASALEQAGGTSLGAHWRRMASAPLLALGVGAALALFQRGALAPAAPVLLLWLGAPAIAWWISLPLARRAAPLTARQNLFLNSLARKTWAFFETFVGPDENWLPPDNMQEQPNGIVAHRTSPTNIGMALLANLTASDFGFISVGQLLERSANTFATMDRLERHQGHFYNWYDTLTLTPLQPLYVSSVDSGNLAGHLLTLQAGLFGLADQPICAARQLDGLRTTLAVLREHANEAGAAVHGALDLFEDALSEPPAAPAPDLAQWHVRLRQMVRAVDAIVAAEALGAALAAQPDMLLREWVARLALQCHAAQAELAALTPWLAAPDSEIADAALLVIPTLRELASFTSVASVATDLAPAERQRQQQLGALVAAGRACAQQRLAQIDALAERARVFAQMDFRFLYNRATKLMVIGYNVGERRLDPSSYDLLASEVRLASFVAIAQGQLPQEHWFALGRQLGMVGNLPVLMSWSGSMFEYLMPLLVMPSFPNTLLEQTYRAVIAAQIEYAEQRDVPWGISESGYNTVDTSLNYQYRAFGVPGLGLKRGLADDLVIAPYATMLGLMVEPDAACANLERMAADGFMGRYGFYEAIDYTASRLRRGQRCAVVRSFMAHHQGMGLLALSYLLHERPMQRRFESDPQFQATMLILQERVPKSGAFYPSMLETAAVQLAAPELALPQRVVHQTTTARPEIALLSNGRYHVMVTAAGGGSSRWKELAVTRWQPDASRDNWGSFCYLRDCDDGTVWSTTFQPTLAEPDSYEVVFSEGRAEFRRSDHGLDMYTEVVVSPEDDVEVRRTRITNKGSSTRTIELTSYCEVVLAPAASDAAHPAFSKLFVQTEVLRESSAILCARRARTKGEATPSMLHMMAVHDARILELSFETDRLQFIGRGNSTLAPQAMGQCVTLSGQAGSVLDPVVAIRYRIEIAPGQVASVDIVTGVCDTREGALHLVDKYQDRHLAERVFELSWTHSQVVLRQLNASESDAQLYARLANTIIYPDAALRADPATLARNQRGQSGLWAYAISGDLPIVLLQITDNGNIELVRQLVQAHAYWRLKGLVVDLVIWYEDLAGYRQLLHEQIMGLIASGTDASVVDRPGGIFVRPLDQIAAEDRVLMQSVARVVLSDQRGTLAEQIARAETVVPEPVALLLADPERAAYRLASDAVAPPRALILHNGQGGFTPDGCEYVIELDGVTATPAPWVNVLANPGFGSVISESGQATTWSENAHEFRLTPWHNDPVSDQSGEAFYLRDEQSGEFWSPTALPVAPMGPYVTRHGFGYSVFEHRRAAINSELTVFVALDAPIKYAVLKVRNDSTVPRRLSATGYVEWVLAEQRAKSAMHIVTELDGASGALLARNPYNSDFGGRVAFFQVDAPDCSVTGDRKEFIGRNGSLAAPAAMGRSHLSGHVGSGLDPCAALQVAFELAPGQQRELVFMLGVGGRRTADAGALVLRHAGAEAARQALAKVRGHWQQVLGAVQIDTPEPQLDVLANGWLMYQTIACRLWARSGYYQSGGAFGFRDQLQDTMAMIHTQPQLLREQLLLCAAHQFVEGDVQHWWHPPTERGVRTHCSDDYLWLPLALHRYVTSTGERALLDEVVPFIEGRAVTPEEDSYFDLPSRSEQRATLYEHAARAVRRALRYGVHGLPLIGSCDWNDGMDQVGAHGKGESVWLGFFLVDVLGRFAELAQMVGESEFAAQCVAEAGKLSAAIEQHGWDGAWYRRAYFDDGTPLGSAENDECQIDAIAQSWSVLSGVAPPERAHSAMQALDARLVRRDAGLVQLLDPPFDDGVLNPGYIRGYVPGVRENGGQYTHAAIWSAMAFAKLGDGARAWELLRMLNPVNHASAPDSSARYKVEPYVVAADVYAVAPHVGRGGWTWYTGSSGWMYRLIVESLLGVNLAGDRLTLAPMVPPDWPGFRLRYRYRSSVYAITVEALEAGGVPGLTLDGVAQHGNVIALADDGGQHVVTLRVARPAN